MKFWVKKYVVNGTKYDIELDVKRDGLKLLRLYKYVDYDGDNKIVKEINKIYSINIFYKRVRVENEKERKDIERGINWFMGRNIFMEYPECEEYEDEEDW